MSMCGKGRGHGVYCHLKPPNHSGEYKQHRCLETQRRSSHGALPGPKFEATSYGKTQPFVMMRRPLSDKKKGPAHRSVDGGTQTITSTSTSVVRAVWPLQRG